jgi:hypothetical protein
MLQVRYGKAVHGQPPRRRNVPSVMEWAVDAVADYVENIRPRFGCGGSSGVVGDRARRTDQANGDQRPVRVLPRRTWSAEKPFRPIVFDTRGLRTSQSKVDRRFIQEAVGHRCDTSTAIYTHLSGDFMNTALRKALASAFDQPAEHRKEPGDATGAMVTCGPLCARGREYLLFGQSHLLATGVVTMLGVAAGMFLLSLASRPEDPARRHEMMRGSRSSNE